MCAVILVFAFVMSLIINVAERMILSHNKEVADRKEQEQFAVENQE